MRISYFDTLYFAFDKNSKLKLPSENCMSAVGGDEDRDLDMPTRASTRMSRVSVKLPMSSVAGVKGDEAEKFQEYQDMSTRVKPKSHCWLPSGDVLIGCSGGQLLKVRRVVTYFGWCSLLDMNKH